MLLDDLVFRLEHYRNNDWDGGEHFRFYKIKKLVDQYEAFFSRLPDWHPSHMLELGIFDGGSTVFWHELFQPHKLVAVDIKERTDSPYFRQYLESRGVAGKIKTIWNVNQADKDRLHHVVAEEMNGRLDMVIDDASHFYEPTKASFEVLFPLCKPGALYIIEDWAWDHWAEFSAADHPWAEKTRLTQLVTELVEAVGTSTDFISNMTVFEGFAVIERGPKRIDAKNFVLEDHIVRRPARRKSFRLAPIRRALMQPIVRLVKFLRKFRT